MKKLAIIVAGGSGHRMKSDIPKQFLPLKGIPIVMRSLQTFYDYDKNMPLYLVIPESYIDYWEALCNEYKFNIPHQVVAGGETRYHSVRNAVMKLKGDSLVAIHDAVRPLVNHTTLETCFLSAATKGNVVPSLEPVDSFRQFRNNRNFPVNRHSLRIIQTPQVFHSDQLKNAYDQPFMPAFTDDANVIERLGYEINLVEGNRENMKITGPQDIKLAEAFLSLMETEKLKQ